MYRMKTLSERKVKSHESMNYSGGLLSTLPLELRLRGKSTTQSHRAAIYYVDLIVRTGMTMAQAIASARAQREERRVRSGGAG